ncbi:membrane protein [Actinoplanes sp. SE50]|uniref:hypothetical protein n=1 Tax=unclassified Actinoplanes TaxID=2626549 RepID=UPI00023ED46A|nr:MULTISPECIES: hypothetical protein [unclassified Actinoplanes]AEV85602.1 hypothetical protein ACPL_4711 [Actinoplanes sp. SE50/110]ATO83995.1 membrane protein [Actinoplanes sp. SE50]SLM01405.1 hypothetical protein ACSP50_4641 [Actinoplanes sp. SE50/110]
MRPAARLTSGPVRLHGLPRGDRWALAGVLGLVAAAAVVGAALGGAGHPVLAPAAPIFGHVRPHIGPGTPLALAVAIAVIRWGPALAATLPWRRLLVGAWLAAVAWTFSLALIDGWQRGVAGRLTTQFEYLSEVPRVTDIPAMLRGFTSHILLNSPDHWAEHVSGHPPGVLLTFVWLDRIGLGGGAWAATVCILVGCLITVAVPSTLRSLDSDGAETAARAAVPFLVLFPGAVWIGVSADGMFAGIGATAVALLAAGLARPSRRRLLLGGALLAWCAYLSYGLVLLVLPAATLLVGRHRRWPLLIWPILGAAAVVAALTGYGFAWWEGYHLVKIRYYQGIATARPYAYWIWANLASLACVAGPAAAPMLRRAALALRAARGPAAWLCLGGLAAALAADISGLSKAETERIWLPFAVWLPAAAVLLPLRDRRFWMCLQAATALLVNHLILTTW